MGVYTEPSVAPQLSITVPVVVVNIILSLLLTPLQLAKTKFGTTPPWLAVEPIAITLTVLFGIVPDNNKSEVVCNVGDPL